MSLQAIRYHYFSSGVLLKYSVFCIPVLSAMVHFNDYVAGNVRGFMAEVLYWSGLLHGEPSRGVYFIVSTAEVGDFFFTTYWDAFGFQFIDYCSKWHFLVFDG